MKNLFVILLAVTVALAFLALPMGQAANAQQAKQDKVKLTKGFAQDDSAYAAIEKKKQEQPDKIFGEMELESASGETVKIYFTNPCTYICFGTRCYLKCVP